MPDRRYDLAGRFMARAITDAERDDVPVTEALSRAALQAGKVLGQKSRNQLGRRPSRKALTAAACELLAQLGYEPRVEGGGMSLDQLPLPRSCR